MAAYAGIGSRTTPERSPRSCGTSRTPSAPAVGRCARAAPHAPTRRSTPARWKVPATSSCSYRGRTYEQPALIRWGEPTLRLERPDPAAHTLAERFHPGWPRLKSSVRGLMARNCRQIRGATLRDPVRFVVCWTPDGSLDGASRESGGTGMALRLATHDGIEVFNLARPDHLEQIHAFTGRPLT